MKEYVESYGGCIGVEKEGDGDVLLTFYTYPPEVVMEHGMAHSGKFHLSLDQLVQLVGTIERQFKGPHE